MHEPEVGLTQVHGSLGFLGVIKKDISSSDFSAGGVLDHIASNSRRRVLQPTAVKKSLEPQGLAGVWCSRVLESLPVMILWLRSVTSVTDLRQRRVKPIFAFTIVSFVEMQKSHNPLFG